MTATLPSPTGVGASARRVEDPVILAGRGVYVGDVQRPGMLHAAVVRSPYPHARIVSVDTSAAADAPGVVAVLTGARVAELVGPIPTFGEEGLTQDPVAVDKVRFEGEAVAVVAAESRAEAEDACELVRVEYEQLPIVGDPRAALAPGAPLVHEAHGSNLLWSRELTFGPVDADFAEAAHVVERSIRWNRMSAQAIETAGVVVEWTPGDRSMTVWSNANMTNMYAASFAGMLRVGTQQLTLVPCLVGGNFGSKILLGKHMCVAGALAKVTGRPVRYLDDRLEHVQSADNTACDRYYDARLAVAEDGTFLSLDVSVIDDQGAYSLLGPTSHGNAMATPTGPYRIRSFRYHPRNVLTNKVGQAVFRGAGSEPMNFVVERLVDLAAEELGRDPVELRAQNLIRADEFPYRAPHGNHYDSGDYLRVLETAARDERVKFWREEQERARAEGRYIGIGLASCQERTTWTSSEIWVLYDNPSFPVSTTPETVDVTIDAMGTTFVTVASAFVGNSPLTVASQVLSTELGIDPSTIAFRHADSRSGLVSPGATGSRTTVMLAGALKGAAGEIRDKLIRLGAHMLEADPADLELAEGSVRVKGAPESAVPFGILVATANMFALDLPEGMSSGLRSTYRYDHPYASKPSADRTDLGIFYPIVSHGCHVAVVEVDPETGVVTPLSYLAVNDSGTVMNPRLLDGQVRGGVVQGIGAALSEQYRYGEDGYSRTRDYTEYLLPTIDVVPREFRVLHHETPSPYTAYGVKGGGEGGRLTAPSAVISAVEDALRPFGVRIDEAPVTPERLVELVVEAHTWNPSRGPR